MRIGADDLQHWIRLHGVSGIKTPRWNCHRGHGPKLFADFGTVFFGEIFVAEGAMEIHSRPQHMRVDDKNFLTIWTSDFNGLTHDLPLSIYFGFSDLMIRKLKTLGFGYASRKGAKTPSKEGKD
ncbi:MAG: hypothetical protein ACXWW4_18045 [Candidatus Binatia bacterium]